jgi:DNA-binding transcriptional LysR family regulator
MELKWFEDYLELVAARNFSTAATARRISQSAFSRRINALENWAGAELIDRRTNPITLTKAGELFFPRCREILNDIYRSQSECQQGSDASKKLVSFASMHTIALFFFPDWIHMVEQKHGDVQLNMHADNYYECIEQLTLGNSDFIISYDHDDGPPVLKKGPFESVRIGVEKIFPVSALGSNGRPLYEFSTATGNKAPYLSYSWQDGYISKLLTVVHSRQQMMSSLTTVYESSLAEGIKRMAIAGRGIGWIPESCASDAIARGELCQVGGAELTLELDILLFRRKGNDDPELAKFWNNVCDCSSRGGLS